MILSVAYMLKAYLKYLRAFTFLLEL
jgi:hypothetical protein